MSRFQEYTPTQKKYAAIGEIVGFVGGVVLGELYLNDLVTDAAIFKQEPRLRYVLDAGAGLVLAYIGNKAGKTIAGNR